MPIYIECTPNVLLLQDIQVNANNIQHFSLDKSNKNNYGYMSMYYALPPHVLKYIIEYDMYQCDVLFLPKGWWHYICSDPDTLSFTMWNNNLNISKPYLKKNLMYVPNQNVDISDLNKWCENNLCTGVDSDSNMYMSLDKYCVKKSVNQEDTLEYVKEQYIKNNLYVNGSVIYKWYSSGQQCTPLHYDDYDNILFVAK